MKLLESTCTIDKIMLDPLNPRFGTNLSGTNQLAILKRLLDKKESKELLNSMKRNIKWVSKIVIRSIESLTEEELSQYPSEIKDFEYIVVEGNTRLACLKSGKIDSFDILSEIPVLIAQKESDETDTDYLNEIKVTQGISNIMIVKQWGEIAKAKHLYELCNSKIQQNNTDNLASIIRSISLELGMSTNDVRKFINRYAFYKEINDISDTIPDRHWGYLEPLDKNSGIRKRVGMVEGSLDFEWNIEDDSFYPYLDIKKELLIEIPKIIQAADEDGLNTKQFRDAFVSIISEARAEELESVKDRLIQTTDMNDRSENWMTIFEGLKAGNSSQEEEWSRKITDIKNQLDALPLQSKWILEYDSNLTEISDLLVNALEIIEFRKNKFERINS